MGDWKEPSRSSSTGGAARLGTKDEGLGDLEI